MLLFDRLLGRMTKPAMALLIIVLISLTYFYIDKPLAYYFHNLDLRTNLFVLNWITKLGLGIVYIPTFLLFAGYFRYISPNPVAEGRSWFLALCVIIPSLVCVLLKVLLGRARPDLLFSAQLYGFYGIQGHASFWSFPSGHTTVVMGAAYGLSAVFPRQSYAFIGVGLLIAFTRVFLTHHYLSDIMVASYLSLLEVGIIFCIFRRKSWLAPAWDLTFTQFPSKS